MPYRHAPNQPAGCIICSKETAALCRNCQTSHCELHLLDGRCAGCEAALWHRESIQLRRATLAYGALALPGVVLLSALASAGLVAAGLGASALLGLGGVYAMVRISPKLVRRRLADAPSRPSSRPMLPAQVLEQPAEVEEPTKRLRPRGLRTQPRRRAIRAVFMTRGGYFYQ